MSRWWENERLLIILGVSFFVFDQVIKFIMIRTSPSIDLSFVKFHFVKNTGASFGILQGQNALFIWVGIITLGIFLFYFDRVESSMRGLGIIVAFGVVSNTFDRVVHGFVVDYVNLGWFPVFNIADAMISIGVSIIVFFMLREDIIEKLSKKK